MCASTEPTIINWKWTANGRLTFCEKFVLNSSVPDSIVELTRYECKKGCKTNSSSCKRANVVFIDPCSCNINGDCENTNH